MARRSRPALKEVLAVIEGRLMLTPGAQDASARDDQANIEHANEIERTSGNRTNQRAPPPPPAGQGTAGGMTRYRR